MKEGEKEERKGRGRRGKEGNIQRGKRWTEMMMMLMRKRRENGKGEGKDGRDMERDRDEDNDDDLVAEQ